MKMKCLDCGADFNGELFYDELGFHGQCPECGSSSDHQDPCVPGRLFIKPEELWEYCQENFGRLQDRCMKVADTGDGDDDIALFITVNDFDDENAKDFLLSLEDCDTIIDSEQFATPEGAVESARLLILKMINLKEEQ